MATPINRKKRTGEKPVEMALRESEERFQAAMVAVNGIVWTNDAQGMMQGEQPSWGAFTGQTRAEYQGYGWTRAVHPEDATATLDAWKKAVAEKRLFCVEHRARRHDGQWRWFSVRAMPVLGEQGEIREWVGVHADITDHKQAAQALRESEKHFRNLADNLPQLAWIADMHTNGQINWFNRTWFTYTGTTLEEMRGAGWRKVHHPEHAARVIEKFERHVREGLDWEDTFPLRRADGEFRWFLSRMKVIRNAAGEVTKLFGTNTDITDQRAAADALALAKEKVEAASRAKDDFIAALSHELRTPLSPVLMAAAALVEDERLPVDAREQLKMIERNIALEARLIDDLLDLTAIARGKIQLRMETSDAHSLIGMAVEIVRAEAQAKGIHIERTFAARHSALRVDPARFQQVIWNLLRNAVKFTPNGGRISIETDEEKAPDEERWLQIKVVDSGIGIASELLDKIFMPFDQGSLTGAHRFGGLGLGLAIARTVVELHGGLISAQSDGANQGATFVVRLPGAVYPSSGFAESGPPFSSNSPSPLSPPSPSVKGICPQRLLLVEDHESTLKVLAGLLRRDGHQVVTATTVAGALAIAAANEFDLVISDLGLSDGTGHELMEKLRTNYGLKGVALTGYGMEEDVVRSRAAGFVAHLIKPIRIAELRLTLASLTATL